MASQIAVVGPPREQLLMGQTPGKSTGLVIAPALVNKVTAKDLAIMNDFPILMTKNNFPAPELVKPPVRKPLPLMPTMRRVLQQMQWQEVIAKMKAQKRVAPESRVVTKSAVLGAPYGNQA